MRRKIGLIWLFALLLSGCATEHRNDEQTLYVSILPLRQIVKEIVGDDFNVAVLVPSGASPETFEPTPKQFIALNRAQMVFCVGLIDFETTLLSKIADTSKIVNLSRGIQTIAGSCSHHVHGHNHVHGVDPHIWTSPRELQVMAANAYAALRVAYPDSVKYEAGYNRLSAKLMMLDRFVIESFSQFDIKYFIIYHPALTYYARDYGLEQVAIEDDGKEPSAKRLAKIISKAQTDGVKRIFYQRQFPASAVEVIANDIGGEAVAIDPLQEDVIANIMEITDLIVDRR